MTNRDRNEYRNRSVQRPSISTGQSQDRQSHSATPTREYTTYRSAQNQNRVHYREYPPQRRTQTQMSRQNQRDPVYPQRSTQTRRKSRTDRAINKMLVITILVLSAIVVFLLFYCLLRFAFGFDMYDRSGWRKGKDGTRQYLSYEGNLLTGWQTLEDGMRCYFTEDGILQTGWFTVDGVQYYWDDGQTGWVTIDGVDCYINEDLTLKTGWVDRDGKRYYYEADGTFLTGWTDIGKHRYYFDADGVMQTGWFTWEGDTYYLKEDGRMAKGQVAIENVNHFFTSAGKQVLLVNHLNAMPEDYEVDLVEYGSYQVSAECVDALTQMIEGCRSAGYQCYVGSIYRSKDEQNYLWQKSYRNLLAKGYAEASASAETDKSLMRAGYSEHHTGLAVDFYDSYDLSWLHANCWDYGFIVRYPEGKSDITGIIYEPWHFRYVGVELAQELKSLGLCLEEYMQMLTQENNA